MIYLDFLMMVIKTLIIIGAILTIAFRNPIYSVLFLVFTFINTSILLLFFHIEYFAILLILVYLGAIAVLFLFVVMLLNIKIFEVTEQVIKFVPFPLLIVLFYFILFLFFTNRLFEAELEFEITTPFWVVIFFQLDNVSSLASLIFSQHFIFVFLAALILLVSLISSIFLTLTKGGNGKLEIEVFKLLKDRENELVLLSRSLEKE